MRWLLLSLACGVLGACSGDGDDGMELRGTNWVLVDIAGEAVPPSPQATLEFSDDGRIGGRGPCNHFGGSVEIDADKIQVDELMQTLMSCGSEVDAQEARYVGALGKAERVAIDHGSLLVYYQGSDKPLRFRAP